MPGLIGEAARSFERQSVGAAICDELPNFLSWSSRRRTARLLSLLYRKSCHEKGIRRLSADPRCIDLLGLSSSLPLRRLRDVFSAPRIAWRVLRDDFSPDEDGPDLAEALMFEALRSGARVPLPRAIYSARCDLIFDPAEPGPRACAKFLEDVPFGLEVADTPNLFMKSGNAVGTSAYEDRQVSGIIEKLATALGVVREASPEAYLLVCDAVEICALRERPGSRAFETGTFSGCAGFVLLTNGHLAGVCDLAEGLVHEAVHCALYKHEAVFGGFVTDAEREDDPVVSPWSGRSIRLHSFVHACLVWYALHLFWRQCGRLAHFSEDAAGRVARAGRGFLQQPVSEILKSFHAVIRADILEVLGTVERRVLTDERTRLLGAVDGGRGAR